LRLRTCMVTAAASSLVWGVIGVVVSAVFILFSVTFGSVLPSKSRRGPRASSNGPVE
jgi:hypothetical protein